MQAAMEAMRRKREALQAMAYLGQASAFLDWAQLGQLLFLQGPSSMAPLRGREGEGFKSQGSGLRRGGKASSLKGGGSALKVGGGAVGGGGGGV